MGQRIEEWLERMRMARNPGPLARIAAARNGRDAGWVFDVMEETHLGDLAERIDNTCRDAGAAGTYEFRALDAEGKFVGAFSHRIDASQIVPVGPTGLAPALPYAVDDAVAASLKSHRSFAGLGLQSVLAAQRATERILKKLERENDKLRAENEGLRTRIVDTWEILDKIHTHEIEAGAEKDKSERMGRMAEMFVTAAFARLFGRDATPEGAQMEARIAMAVIRSLRPEQIQDVMTKLDDDQKLGVMELLRPRGGPAGNVAVAKPDANGAHASGAVNGKAT